MTPSFKPSTPTLCLRGVLVAATGVIVTWLAGACGARTGLYEYGPDASTEAGVDALHEPDASHEPDVVHEPEAEAEADAPPDLGPLPDVVKDDCTDPTIQYVYVVTISGNLYSFRPSTLGFSYIGKLSCPSTETPFSMAVDRKGTAYVEYQDGEIFKVNVATASCAATPYVYGTKDFTNFGMGYATDQGGPAESLYLANSALLGGSPMLGKLDTDTFDIQVMGYLGDSGFELTGTGDGRLFGFFQPELDTSHLVQLNKNTGEYLTEVLLPNVSVGQGWAFAFWGGDFWFFTASSGYSTVTRYQPDQGVLAVVTELPNEVIVGAGVSTCAPEQ